MTKHASSVPYSITRAITILVTGKYKNSQAPQFSRCTVSTLQAILSYVSAKNAITPIFPSRDKLAQRTGYTIRSVQRALLELESAGWIQRLHQQRKRVGNRITNDFSIVPICLTAIACDHLSLSYELESIEKIQQFTLLVTRSGATKKPHAIKPNQPKAVQIHSAKQKHLSDDQPVRIGHYSIPKKLVWLVRTAQLSLPQIFLLMRKFSSQGMKLENFLQNAEMKIALLKGQALFAYLLKCGSKFTKQFCREKSSLPKVDLIELARPLLCIGPMQVKTKIGFLSIRFSIIDNQVWVSETDNTLKTRIKKATAKEITKALSIASLNKNSNNWTSKTAKA